MLLGSKALTFARKQMGLFTLVVLISGCGDGPPTKTMVKIDETRAGLAPLTATRGKGASHVARATLLLDPKVREEAGKIGASIDQIAIEQAALRPSLGLGLVGGVGDASSGKASAQLSATQLVFDFGGTKRAVEAADLKLQAQYLTFQQQVDASLTEGLLTYREVATMTESVRIREAQFAAMKDLHGLIAQRVESGASPSPDLLETRNRLQRVEYNLLEAKLELSELRDKLQRLTGQNEGGALPNFTGNCAPAGGMTDNMRLSQLNLALAQLELDTAARARMPRVSLNPLAAVGLDGGGISTGLNLNVDSSLFQGGAIKARENAARNRLGSATAAVEAAKRDMQLDELRLRRQITAAKEKQSMLARQIEIQSETRDLYRSQYFELGTRQITDLLDAEETLYDRQIDRVVAQFDLQKALVECAARSKALRSDLGLTSSQIYGYPLTKDGF